MKKLLALPLVLLAAAPAALAQSPTTSAQKYQMCQAVRMANQDGISGKFMLEQMLAQRGQPKYLANVIMNDIKPACPNAY